MHAVGCGTYEHLLAPRSLFKLIASNDALLTERQQQQPKLSNIPSLLIPFIRIGRAKHQEAHVSPTAPHDQVSKQVRKDHPDSSLDVLQCEVFPPCSAVHLKLRTPTSDCREYGEKSTYYRVEPDVWEKQRENSKQGACYGIHTALIMRADVLI